MPADDPPDSDKEARIPSQIPLLVDIATEKKPARVRKKKKKENYMLDLNPDPPQTLDLFAPPTLKDAVEEKHDSDWNPNPEVEAEMEARFRQEANDLVDSLVKQYSEEILKKLRSELSSLLDDLNSGSQATENRLQNPSDKPLDPSD